MAVLDNTFLVDIEAREESALLILASLLEMREPLRIPAAAWIEFLCSYPGARQSAAARTLAEAGEFEAVTREIADTAARLQAEMRRTGRTLAWHDLQVAATALHYGESLVTNDQGFRHLPGIEVRSH